MVRKTDSLLPLILRLLTAVAIAGVLGFCSLAIERTNVIGRTKHAIQWVLYNGPN